MRCHTDHWPLGYAMSVCAAARGTITGQGCIPPPATGSQVESQASCNQPLAHYAPVDRSYQQPLGRTDGLLAVGGCGPRTCFFHQIIQPALSLEWLQYSPSSRHSTSQIFQWISFDQWWCQRWQVIDQSWGRVKIGDQWTVQLICKVETPTVSVLCVEVWILFASMNTNIFADTPHPFLDLLLSTICRTCIITRGPIIMQPFTLVWSAPENCSYREKGKYSACHHFICNCSLEMFQDQRTLTSGRKQIPFHVWYGCKIIQSAKHCPTFEGGYPAVLF